MTVSTATSSEVLDVLASTATSFESLDALASTAKGGPRTQKRGLHHG